MVDYKRLYEVMPAPRFQIERSGPKGRLLIRLPNAAACTFFGGLNREARHFWVLETYVSGDDYVEFARAYQTVISTGVEVRVNLQSMALLPSGSKPTPRPFKLCPFSHQPDEGGGPVMVDVIGSTNLRGASHLENERDDALMMMRSISDLSEIATLVTDDQYKIVRVNESMVRHFGWQESELIGQDVTEFVTTEVRKVMVGRSGEGPNARQSGELRVIRRDGSVANVLFTATTMTLSGGRLFQVYTLMDITLRKRMEETLRAAKERADSASRAKSMFLANMSHELRTPLNAIMGFSELMMQGTFGAIDNARYEGYITDIHKSAEHLLDIINEVLDMSKVEAGKVDLDEDWIDVRALVCDVIRMMESRAFGKGVEFVYCQDDPALQLLCDRRMMRQVLINLMMNAVKFSPSDSVVDVVARRIHTGALRFQIYDTGVGIPEDKIAQVLEPFGQVDDGRDYAPQEGTGLGLPLAKAMVELHGGRFEIRSKVGKGTQVDLLFGADRVRDEA